jgi:hypothetical protein
MPAILFQENETKRYEIRQILFLLRGHAADATDAPQPWKLIVRPSDEDEVFFFCFSILMEHRWNEIDRGKPKF